MKPRPRAIDASAVIRWLETENAREWKWIKVGLWICRDAPVDMFPLDYTLVREHGVTVAIAVTVYTKSGHAIPLGTVSAVGDEYDPFFAIGHYFGGLEAKPVTAYARAA